MINDLPQAGTIAFKILLAAVLTGVVGLEREWTGKSAGLRTHMLMAVGATLLTHISSYPTGHGGTWDSGRLAAQIVTGVGFICGGAILRSRGGIHGLTTAAGLWVSAAIGIAIGAGDYASGTITAVALMLILTFLRPLEERLVRGHTSLVAVRISPGQTVAQLVAIIEDEAIETCGIEVARGTDPLIVTVKVRGGSEGARRLVETARVGGFEVDQEAAPPPPPRYPPLKPPA